MVTISYLGPKGTFTEEALTKFLKELWQKENTQLIDKGKEVELRICQNIDEIVDTLMNDEVEFAFLPIENSMGGGVLLTTEFLSHYKGIEICAEIILSVRHHLWTSAPDIGLEDIDTIYSHPQALLQCRGYLRKNLPKVKTREMASTAMAAEFISTHHNRNSAALGGDMLGRTYNLHKLVENVQENQNNQTRFILVRKRNLEIAHMTYHTKTSVVFEVDGMRPGSLYESLGIFARRKINLVRIESRPTKEHLGEYKFFFDLHTKDDSLNIKEALYELKELATKFQLLGSYDIWEIK